MGSIRLKEKVADRPRRRTATPVIVNDGLCATCRHAPACSFRRQGASAVMECYEFDDRNGTVHDVRAAAHVRTPLRSGNGHGLAGLCMNCDVRETCTLAGREGGVWHCGEYR